MKVFDEALLRMKVMKGNNLFDGTLLRMKVLAACSNLIHSSVYSGSVPLVKISTYFLELNTYYRGLRI